MKKLKTCKGCFHQYVTGEEEISVCGMAPPSYISIKQWDIWRQKQVKKMDSISDDCDEYLDRKMMNEIYDGVLRDKKEEMAYEVEREWQQSTY